MLFNKSKEPVSGNEEKSKTETVIYLFIYGLIPIAVFYLMEAYEHNPFKEVRAEAQFFNILLFELLGWIFYFLLGRMRPATGILVSLAVLFGITNHYVMKFRSTPFVPWDIFSVGTAASVAREYDFTPDMRMVFVTLGFLLLFFLTHFLKNGPRFSWKIRGAGFILFVLSLCLFVNTLQKESFQNRHYLYPFLFTPAYMTKVNGMAVTFAMDLAYVAVDKPKDYDAGEAKEILEEYGTGEGKGEKDDKVVTKTADLPNIIVVMDEAFSDLSLLGPLPASEDVMPFMHRMQQGQKNTITGYAQVSVCGGNTANSEFEFLTGNTMAFLPNGSIPYQQYIKKETPSLASYLKSLGYETYAQHPYLPSGWNRDQVYPLLGFDHMDFLSDYHDISYVRKYVSDESDMQHIIDTFENKERGKPAFIFNVTMQNHGGYTDLYPDFINGIQSGYESQPLDQYLSLVHLSDQALEKLVNYFSGVEEKTLIVFFGDHQPSDTVASVVENGEETDTKTRYLVPYLVWANYHIDAAAGKNTSLNYLAAQVLSAAGVPTNDYQNYLLKLSETYPVISAAGETKSMGADEKALDTYRKLQYYQLFERK